MKSSTCQMKTLSSQQYDPSINRRVKFQAMIATIGGLCFGYDTGVISGALLFMGDDLGLTPVTEGWVTSSLLIGAAIGSVFGGSLSDRQGRRKNILWIAIIFIIGALGTSLAWDLSSMIVFRIILGLAVGGASVTVPVYIGEITPKKSRESLTSLNEVMIVTGQFLAYSINAGIAVAFPEDGQNWRWMLAIPTIPAVLLWFGMLFSPESPRWFVHKGKVKEARQVLAAYRQADEVESELQEIITIVDNDNSKVSYANEVRKKWVRRLLYIGTLIVVTSQGTGVNTIMYYAPTVLKATGLGVSASLVATIANGVISIISTSAGLYIVSKIRRRTMFLTGQLGVLFALFAIGIAFNTCFHTNIINGEEVLAGNFAFASYLVLFLMLVFLVFMQGFIAPVFWLMLSEIFPLRIRGFGMGISVFFCWVTNFVIALLFPILLSALGGSTTFIIFGLCNVLFILLNYKFLPETKGKTLEEIEISFRAVGD